MAGGLLEHEKTLREQKRFETRARAAHLRHPASVEDVDYRAHRGLDCEQAWNFDPRVRGIGVQL